MRYFFDCTILMNWQGHFTGIQRVVYSLAKGFEAQGGILITPIIINDNGSAALFDLATFSSGKDFNISKGDLVITAAPNWDLPENEKRLLEYRSNGALIVSVLYDVIPWKLPHSYGPGFPEIYNAWLSRMVASSDAILSISESSLKDLTEFCLDLSLNVPKTAVFRLGDDINEFSTMSLSTELEGIFRDKYKDKFILSVGTIEYRKNHILLLNAYRELLLSGEKEPFKLFIVGKEGWLNSDIKYQVNNDPLLKDRIVILEGVSDEELDYLYSNCEYTVYPSIYEGWGLPVAESLRYGKPCIASNSSSLVEISPELVKHLNPFDCKAWSEELGGLLNSSVLAKATAHVSSHYSPYSWKQSAQKVKEFLNSEFSQ